MPSENERRQGRIWLLTISRDDWNIPTSLPESIAYLKGQREVGSTTGYEHWQLICYFNKSRLNLILEVSRRFVKNIFGSTAHCELTRSEAADAYVWKEETRVADTQFQLGRKPHRRNNATDWDAIWDAAKSGAILNIPANVRVQHYRTLRTIASDYSEPLPMERQVFVYCGRTGTGKSRRAWDEAGFSAYPKDPRTKFWDGYRDQPNVVIDEFRGGIDISHILRWLDRYPVLVEIKGSSTPLVAQKIWITSNVHPFNWYPDLDEETRNALLRRLQITEFE